MADDIFRYRPDEIDPTRLDEEKSAQEDEAEDEDEVGKNVGSRRDAGQQPKGELQNRIADYRILSKYLKDG